MYKKPARLNGGFTLIEMLLYVALASILLFIISVLYMLLLQSRIKNQTIAEVEQQGIQAMQQMNQTIRNATAITSPTIGASNAVLTITVPTASKSPTVFDLSGGVLRITEGTTSAALALTSSKVTSSALTFYNLSRSGTNGTVRIQFTITAVNNSGRNEYDYNKTFYGSASLR